MKIRWSEMRPVRVVRRVRSLAGSICRGEVEEEDDNEGRDRVGEVMRVSV